MKKKAVALLSGGLDSTAALAIAKKEEFDVYALSFDYRQRHRIEIENLLQGFCAVNAQGVSINKLIFH